MQRQRLGVRVGVVALISAVVIYAGFLVTATPDPDSLNHQVTAESD